MADTSRRPEEEPLLGRPGDQIQGKEQGIYHNLVTGMASFSGFKASKVDILKKGTAALAQGGIWILTAIVWAAVFNSELILFSAHPVCVQVSSKIIANNVSAR